MLGYSKGVIKSIILFLFVVNVFSVVNIVSASLYVSHVEGIKGIKDFRTVSDTVSFNISSTSAITTINGVAPTCTQESLRYYCAVTDTKNQAVVTYTILNQEGNTATPPVTINVDNSIGTITYSVNNNNGNVTLTYDITDTGFNGAALCTGIDGVNVWWQGSNVGEILFENANTNCQKTGTKELAISESGYAEFYLEVTDKIGNTKMSIVKNITIDVSTPEVSNLEIWSNGVPLTTIAQNTDFPVDITFDIAEDNLTSVIADLSDMVKGPLKVPYKSVSVPLSACRINNTEYGRVYNCVISSKILNTNKESVFINFTAKDSSGNTAVERLEKTFTIDNVVSEVQIVTDYCDSDDICYVKNGPNKFTFQLTKDNFNTRQIYFTVGGVNSRVLNCSGTECAGFASITCNGPTQIRILTIAPFASQDDSGNKLPYYSRTLKCDNSIPVITNIDWGSNSQLGENLLITGSTVSLAVTVNEHDSKITANAYFDKIKNETISATCNELESGNVFNCTWSVSPIEDGYYDADVVIKATDAVNNSATKTEKVRILGFRSDNSTPNNLRASYSRTVPTSLNRAVLQLAEFNSIPMYAYAYYSVSVKQGQDVQLLSQELSVDNCVLRDVHGKLVEASTLFSEIKLTDRYKAIGNDHRIDFTFSGLSSGGGYNQFADGTRVVCNVSAYVREGKEVFKKPQILMVEIPFALRSSQLDSPGEEYVKKIQDIEESTTSDYSNLINNLDKFMVTAQNICTIKNTLDYAGMSGVAIQLAGMGMQFLPGVGQSMKVVGGNAVAMYQDINSIFYDPEAANDQFITGQASELPGMGIIGQACTFMSCNLEWNNPLTLDQGLADSISKTSEALPGGIGKELTTGLTNSDLKNSLVMSAQKLCIPGVVYNLNKYRQVDCEYLECLKVYGASGLDVSQCEVMKSSKTCAIIVGEAFELPFVRVGKNLFSNMADTVRMSYGYGLVAILDYIKSSGVCTDVTSDVAIISCNLPNALQEYLSAQKKTARSNEFYYSETRDFCESAGCVGPKCYPNNQIFGIPLPQFTPTRDQQIQMDMMRRFGELADDRYLLIAAHGSQDEAVRKENLEEWNRRVDKYNTDHGTEYPKVPNVDELSKYDPKNPTSNAKISNYYNAYNADPNNPLPPDDFNEIVEHNPTTDYRVAIESLKSAITTVQNNPFYIGKTVDWGDRQISENTVIADQKQYTNLKNVLPYGRDLQIYSDIKDLGTYVNPAKQFYYFRDNELLFAEQEKGQIIREQKIVTYDADGNPKTLHLTDLPTPPPEWLKDFVTKADQIKMQEKFKDFEESKKERAEKQKAYDDAKEAYRKDRLKQKATVILNILLDQLGMRKFLTAEYWADKWGAGQFITEVADAADPEIWKNNLCNPDNGPLIAGNDQPAGTVYSCYNAPGQGCKLVLTYGADIFDYGNKTYLYTATYLVGPVPRDVQFNIKLKGPSGTKNWYPQNKILKANSYDSSATGVLLNKEYNQICVSFTGNFPDRGDSAKEFCRSIKEDVFRTGKPVLNETTPGYPSGISGGGNPFSG